MGRNFPGARRRRRRRRLVYYVIRGVHQISYTQSTALYSEILVTWVFFFSFSCSRAISRLVIDLIPSSRALYSSEALHLFLQQESATWACTARSVSFIDTPMMIDTCAITSAAPQLYGLSLLSCQLHPPPSPKMIFIVINLQWNLHKISFINNFSLLKVLHKLLKTKKVKTNFHIGARNWTSSYSH